MKTLILLTLLVYFILATSFSAAAPSEPLNEPVAASEYDTLAQALRGLLDEAESTLQALNDLVDAVTDVKQEMSDFIVQRGEAAARNMPFQQHADAARLLEGHELNSYRHTVQRATSVLLGDIQGTQIEGIITRLDRTSTGRLLSAQDREEVRFLSSVLNQQTLAFYAEVGELLDQQMQAVLDAENVSFWDMYLEVDMLDFRSLQFRDMLGAAYNNANAVRSIVFA